MDRKNEETAQFKRISDFVLCSTDELKPLLTAEDDTSVPFSGTPEVA